MKLYVYCLATGIDAFAEPVSGIGGAEVRVLKIDDLAVLASDFDGDSVQVNRENALKHAAVVKSILDRATPLPFRFGTLVSEHQLRSYISARKAALDARLNDLRDCVEMNVKIIWDPSDAEEIESVQSDLKGAGTTFLAEKRREILGSERRSAQAEEISRWLKEQLDGLTRDEQVTVRPSEKLVLAAAHLIERRRIHQYREQLLEARKNRPELHFLFSGPWAPYSFANIELEFKSQFGVS